MVSPYLGIDNNDWAETTKQLIKEHPLEAHVIRDVALVSWNLLWQTKIGEGDTSLSLAEIDPPAIVVGYFFEKLFVKELQRRHQEQWRGTQNKDEKDVVSLVADKYSIEIKTSGQLNTKIFGNRSYGQEVENEALNVKEKSGYYITANFYKRNLTVLRFGWLEQNDWKAQVAQTGQASGLEESAYKYKLFTISGEYILNAPVNLLKGVGNKTAEKMEKEGIKNFSELLQYQGNDTKIKTYREKCKKMCAFDQNNDFHYDDDIIKNVFWWLVLREDISD